MQANLSPVPPQRQAALVIPQDRPVYRITAEKGFFGPDDNLYPVGAIIAWDEEPNQEMEPLNPLAESAMKEYLFKLDACGKAVADKAGRSYNSLADAYENSIKMAQQDAKRVQVINGNENQVPLMGAKKRGRPKINRVDVSDQAPITSLSKGQFGLDKVQSNRAENAKTDVNGGQ